MKKIIFSVLGILFFAYFVSADYTGYLPYMTVSNNDPFNYTFNLYINESSRQITFTGIENPGDIQTVNYNDAQTFTKRINWVWFHGWFYNDNLYINQYIGTGVTHSGNATVVGPGVYEAQVTLSMIPYLGIPFNMPFTVRVDNNAQMVTAWLTIFPSVSFQAPIDQTWNVAGYSFGPYLMQARLVTPPDGGAVIEVEEWIKEDLTTNGLSPRWIVQLNPVNWPGVVILQEPIIKSSEKNSGSSEAEVSKVEIKQEVSDEIVQEETETAEETKKEELSLS